MKSTQALHLGLAQIGLLDFCERHARRHNVSLDCILGPLREHHIVRARHSLWAVLRATLGLSYPAIGRLFGRDHTTVMYGVQEHERGLSEMRGTL